MSSQRARATTGVALDVLVLIAGVATLLAIVTSGGWLPHPAISWLDGVLVVGVLVGISRFPMVVATRVGTIDITFAPATLIFLALRYPPATAALVWLVGEVGTAFGDRHKSVTTRLFNLGLTSLAGALPILFIPMTLAGPPRLHDGLGGGLAALVVAGVLVYFALDYVLTTASITVWDGLSWRSMLPDRTLVVPLLCFLGIGTIGYLGALIAAAYGSATLLLLVVPLAAILVATRALARERLLKDRTARLLGFSRRASEVTSEAELLALVVAQTRELLPGTVELATTPPDDKQVGGALSAVPGSSQYLVVSPSGRYRIRQDDREAVAALLSLTRDAVQRVRLLVEITQLARFDGLTGLLNRRSFHAVVAQGLAQPGGEGRRALLFCDLDGFKGVNDRLGHAAGDDALRHVADRLRSAVRDGDVVSRLGGDEFAVLTGLGTDAAAATSLAWRIVTALRAPYVVAGQPLQLGVSIGVAVSSPAGHDQESTSANGLVLDADTAMYRAKSTGTNQVVVFDSSMRARQRTQLMIEDDLRAALDNGELWLAFQPAVDMRDSTLNSFEVLLRWTHPVHGAVDPQTIVSVARSIGLLPDLGYWVLEEAHARGRELAAAAGKSLPIAVNVAAEQLLDPRFVSRVLELATDPSVLLCLELTENSLVADRSTGQALERIHAAGVLLAIDDFGVGSSSISYLHRFPFIEAVKIDQSFVSRLDDDERSRQLTASIVAMGRAFGVLLLAEGIETQEVAAYARALGIDVGQGYLYGGPMPFADALTVAMTPTRRLGQLPVS